MAIWHREELAQQKKKDDEFLAIERMKLEEMEKRLDEEREERIWQGSIKK